MMITDMTPHWRQRLATWLRTGTPLASPATPRDPRLVLPFEDEWRDIRYDFELMAGILDGLARHGTAHAPHRSVTVTRTSLPVPAVLRDGRPHRPVVPAWAPPRAARDEGRPPALLRRFGRPELAVPHEQLRWSPNIGLRGLHALPLKVTTTGSTLGRPAA